MEYPGNLFVVAAPSGAGKSSLVKALLELDSHVQPSVSHTTRAPRGQEKHGREYFFTSQQEFDAMVAAGRAPARHRDHEPPERVRGAGRVCTGGRHRGVPAAGCVFDP